MAPITTAIDASRIPLLDRSVRECLKNSGFRCLSFRVENGCVCVDPSTAIRIGDFFGKDIAFAEFVTSIRVEWMFSAEDAPNESEPFGRYSIHFRDDFLDLLIHPDGREHSEFPKSIESRLSTLDPIPQKLNAALSQTSTEWIRSGRTLSFSHQSGFPAWGRTSIVAVLASMFIAGVSIGGIKAFRRFVVPYSMVQEATTGYFQAIAYWLIGYAIWFVPLWALCRSYLRRFRLAAKPVELAVLILATSNDQAKIVAVQRLCEYRARIVAVMVGFVMAMSLLRWKAGGYFSY